jgi:hypothetical protein
MLTIEITSAHATKTAKFFVDAFGMKIIHWATGERA